MGSTTSTTNSTTTGSSGDFQVHPDSLTGLARDFTTSAGDLGDAAAGFNAGVIEVGEAFGLLGVCSGVAGKYLELTQHTAEGLGKLVGLLRADASGLSDNQTAYAAVEQHNASMMRLQAG